MVLAPSPQRGHADSWRAFGHSYLQYAYGTVDPTGRADSVFRALEDIETANWRNHAVNGAQVMKDGRSVGGYTNVFQDIRPVQRNYPYVGDGGGTLFGYGINDAGFLGVSTQWKAAFKQAMRAVISRARAAVLFENDFSVGTRTSYGAGFSSIAAADWASGPGGAGVIHWATSLTNATITMTLPSDYQGEPVAVCMGGQASTAGGVMTYSGSAGVTGTISNSDIVPAGGGTHTPVVQRITNLTAANQGQTIILTGTSLDAGGALQFDGWWLESKNPPPVIVMDIARLPAAGYTTNYAGWSGTEASRDADVDAFNVILAEVVAEFDSMVQLAYTDRKLNKAVGLFFDNLHPNELGAALVVDAIDEARQRLVPPATSSSPTASFHPPAKRGGSLQRIRYSAQWYTSDCKGAGTAYTPVAQDLFAIPFPVTGPRERYIRLCMEIVAVGSASGTIRWGFYDDVELNGYPQRLYNEATSAGAFTVTFGAAVPRMNPATPSAGSITWVPDPSMWWLVMKVITPGTGMTWRSLAGPSLSLPNVTATGALSLNPVGYKLTGQGTGALPTNFPAGGVLSDNVPYIGVQTL